MVCVGILSVLLYCHHQRRLQRYVDRDNLNNNMQRHSLVDSFLEEGEHEWQCSICYHENHPAKPECLMCGTTQVVSQQALASPHKPKEAATMTSSSHNNNNAIEESRHFLQAARQRSFHVRRLNQMNLNQRQRGARRRNLWKRGKGVDGQLRWFRTDQDSTSRVSILTTTPSLRQSTLSDSDESLPNVERRTATTLATESSSAIVVGNPELEDSVEEPQSSLSSSSSTYFHLTPGALAPSTPASPRHRQHAIQFNLMPSTETQLAMSPTGVAMKTKTTAIGGGGGAPPPPPSSCTTFDIPAVADDDSKKDDFESSNDDPLASSSSSSSTRRCDPQGHQLLSQKSIGYVRHVEDDGSVVWVPAHTVDIGDPVSSLDPVEYPRASAVIDFEAIAALPFRHKVRWLLQELDRVSVPWEDGHLLLKIRRDAVLQESLHLLMLVPACDIRQRLRIEFIDEPGLDAGGLMREWVLLLCEQLFDESFGLFQTTHVENLSYWINARSHQMMTKFPTMDHLKCFEFIGRLVAKCLLEGQLLTVHFALPLLKHILGVPISLSDLEFIDETFYKNLCWIRTQDGISNLCLDFTVEHEDARGRRTVVELKPGGASVPVTDENKEEYLNLMLQNKMFTSVSDQISALLKGLYDVIPQTLLAAFDYQELELLLCGTSWGLFDI